MLAIIYYRVKGSLTLLLREEVVCHILATTTLLMCIFGLGLLVPQTEARVVCLCLMFYCFTFALLTVAIATFIQKRRERDFADDIIRDLYKHSINH